MREFKKMECSQKLYQLLAQGHYSILARGLSQYYQETIAIAPPLGRVNARNEREPHLRVL